MRRVIWHRHLGLLGIALGTIVALTGICTAIFMGRFDASVLHIANAKARLVIPLFDMLCFTAAFSLSIYWRKKPEFHRRMMLIATCVLTAAAFGRFPKNILPVGTFYLGVDALILLGLLRDWIVDRKINFVYVYALPLLVLGQRVTMYIAHHEVAGWQSFAHMLIE